VQGTDAPGFSLGAKPTEDRLTGKAQINAKGRVRLQKGKQKTLPLGQGGKTGGTWRALQSRDGWCISTPARLPSG